MNILVTTAYVMTKTEHQTKYSNGQWLVFRMNINLLDLIHTCKISYLSLDIKNSKTIAHYFSWCLSLCLRCCFYHPHIKYSRKHDYVCTIWQDSGYMFRTLTTTWARECIVIAWDGHVVIKSGRWVSSEYYGFRPDEDYTNASIGANEQD